MVCLAIVVGLILSRRRKRDTAAREQFMRHMIPSFADAEKSATMQRLGGAATIATASVGNRVNSMNVVATQYNVAFAVPMEDSGDMEADAASAFASGYLVVAGTGDCGDGGGDGNGNANDTDDTDADADANADADGAARLPLYQNVDRPAAPGVATLDDGPPPLIDNPSVAKRNADLPPALPAKDAEAAATHEYENAGTIESLKKVTLRNRDSKGSSKDLHDYFNAKPWAAGATGDASSVATLRKATLRRVGHDDDRQDSTLYVNDGSADGIVGIVGAPHDRMQSYENTTMERPRDRAATGGSGGGDGDGDGDVDVDGDNKSIEDDGGNEGRARLNSYETTRSLPALSIGGGGGAGRGGTAVDSGGGGSGGAQVSKVAAVAPPAPPPRRSMKKARDPRGGHPLGCMCGGEACKMVPAWWCDICGDEATANMVYDEAVACEKTHNVAASNESQQEHEQQQRLRAPSFSSSAAAAAAVIAAAYSDDLPALHQQYSFPDPEPEQDLESYEVVEVRRHPGMQANPDQERELESYEVVEVQQRGDSGEQAYAAITGKVELYGSEDC